MVLSSSLKGNLVDLKDIKGDKPPVLANIQQLKKLHVRHEIDIHLHNDTISNMPVSMTPSSSDFDEQAQDHYEIHKVLDHRVDAQGVTHYKVQLKGYTKKATLWYQQSDLDDLDLIVEYHTRHPLEVISAKPAASVSPKRTQPKRKAQVPPKGRKREIAVTPPTPDPRVQILTRGRIHTPNPI